jgi:hypothetical protein
MTTKRTVVLGAAATAIAAAVSTPLLAGTAVASAHTFTLRMHQLSDNTVDAAPHGFSAGDNEVQSTRLTSGGKTVGWEAGNCLTTRVAKTADQICTFVFHLSGGEIVSTGAVRAGQAGPGTFELAITGGTKTYSAATGQVSVTSVNRGPVPVTIDAQY